MPNIRLIVEYYGGAFHGWQKQPNLRTVQEELEKALTIILREEISSVEASGRTDSGVHARRQIATFRCSTLPDLNVLPYSVSSLLKGDLGVIKAEQVQEEYHPRKHTHSKQYSYIILNRPAPPTYEWGRVLHLGSKLDREKMQLEASTIIGRHDFTSFRAADCGAASPEREILESELLINNDHLIYRIVGKGFLKQMVRNIVGTLIEIGKGNDAYSSLTDILARKDRNLAGPTAPAHGLFLDWVKDLDGEIL